MKTTPQIKSLRVELSEEDYSKLQDLAQEGHRNISDQVRKLISDAARKQRSPRKATDRGQA